MDGLTFTSRSAPTSDPARMDLACFIGFIGRRPVRERAPGETESRFLERLPEWLRSWFRESDWQLGGAGRSVADLVHLLNVPVPVDTWAVFDDLFAWDEREVEPGGRRRADTWMGAAVRRFFAQGGRKCYVVRLGDPWRIGAPETERIHRESEYLPSLPRPSPVDRGTWRGLGHLFGLPEVSFLCLPDLPDLFSIPLSRLTPDREDVPPERFIECAVRPDPPARHALRGFASPRCNAVGFWRWARWMREIARFLDQYAREVQLIAAVPLADDPSRSPGPFSPLLTTVTHPSELPAHDVNRVVVARVNGRLHFRVFDARGVRVEDLDERALAHRSSELAELKVLLADKWDRGDLPSIERRQIVEAVLSLIGIPPLQWRETRAIHSRSVQLVYPWVRTRESGLLPGGLEPPDGLLAGLLAQNALHRGTWRSTLNQPVDGLSGLEPVLDRATLNSDYPPPAPSHTLRPPLTLRDRVTVIGPAARGVRLLSDVTTAGGVHREPQLDDAYRPANVNRLLAALLKTARRLGEEVVFRNNGEELWRQLREALENFLLGLWTDGALAGATPNEAFAVRCDRSTMTQNDIDAGRVIARVSFSAAMPIVHVTVELALEDGGGVTLHAPPTEPVAQEVA